MRVTLHKADGTEVARFEGVPPSPGETVTLDGVKHLVDQRYWVIDCVVGNSVMVYFAPVYTRTGISE
jgi:hypothetical protein